LLPILEAPDYLAKEILSNVVDHTSVAA
jgi:hypothetical protein